MENLDRRILAIACKFAPNFYSINSIDEAGIAEIVPKKKGSRSWYTKEKFNTNTQPVPEQPDHYILSNYQAFLSQVKYAHPVLSTASISG